MTEPGPTDPATTPGPGPTTASPPGLLTLADKDLLAAAIREGMAPDPPKGWSMVMNILLVLAVAAALIGGYRALQRLRPAVPLAFSADQTATSQQFNFGGATRGVRWQVTSANATGLQITGPDTDTVEISLPLPQSDCAQIATDLGPSAQCSHALPGGGPVLDVASPLSIQWASPDSVELLPPPKATFHQAMSLGVTVTSPGAPMSMSASTPAGPAPSSSPAQASGTGTGSAITLAASGSDRQQWCFDTPFSANTLSLMRGTGQSVNTLSGSGPDIVCGAGLQLVVGSQGGDQPPAITLQNVASMRLHTLTTQQDAQSVVGQLHLGPSGSTVLGEPTEVVVRAKPSAPLDTTLFQQAGRSNLSMMSARATSVLTVDGNLVTSAWDRYQALALPILLAIAGGLIPILLSTMQELTTAHRMRGRHR